MVRKKKQLVAFATALIFAMPLIKQAWHTY